ncbi:MAG TPA: hypothetical protein VGX48_10615 [Pyrinomonadaceae bacterium]|jgi:hypothetical protein|nr:hypothetical protein [Pyrinomonadaceae bacterium]
MTVNNQRPHVILRLLCAATIAVAAGTVTAAAQSSEPKTVADFFLLVPGRYMVGYDRRFREELLRGDRRGVVVDIPNGYISYDESDNPSGFEFAVFRKSNGRHLVAYSTGAFSDPELAKESGNWPTLFLLSYEGGRWRDVTKKSLPVAFDKKLAYKLPRRGRVIEVWDERGRRLYTLTWRNDRFHIDRAAGR